MPRIAGLLFSKVPNTDNPPESPFEKGGGLYGNRLRKSQESSIRIPGEIPVACDKPLPEAGVWGWVRFEYAVEHREYNRQKCSDN